jgi:hypothetical protein
MGHYRGSKTRATRASAYRWAHHVSANLREATMPLLSTLSHVLKLSCNAKLPSHITSVRCFGRVARIPGLFEQYEQVPPFITFIPTRVQSYASSAHGKNPSSSPPRGPIDVSELPTSNANEREVSIQWDGVTRSK